MSPPIEYLSIEKSKLYRLGRKRDLAEILGVTPADLRKLTADDNYEEWTKKQKGKKDRVIEEPLLPLGTALSNLQAVLSRVETPSYLMSGKKRVKPRDNAEMHRFSAYMVNVDIERFYQSTKREFVYLVFKNFFQQKDDVASILADLVTYKGHIPTGTATSQLIAFWAYRQMFDRINKLCTSKGILMSVWVDDITFSSPTPFPSQWVQDIEKIMSKVALSLKTNKTKKYGKNEYKTATGSALSPQGNILVKNEKRKEIIDLLKGRRVEKLSLRETRQLFGKLTSQRQNENDFFGNMHSRCKKHLQKLERAKRKKEKLRKAA
jgi:RNA-directed DNA polymerase